MRAELSLVAVDERQQQRDRDQRFDRLFRSFPDPGLAAEFKAVGVVVVTDDKARSNNQG